MSDQDQLRFVDRPRSVFFIGDSHVGMYDALLLHEAARGAWLIARSDYLRYLQAAHFTDAGGRLNEAVWRSLAAHQFLMPRPSGQGAPFLPESETVQMGLRVPESLDIAPYAAEYALVIVCGEIDSRNILGQLRPTTDIALASAPQGFDALRAAECERVIDDGEFMAHLRRHFAPLEAGLRGLRERGLRRLFLHDLPPPTLDEAEATRVLGFPRPARLRYKVVYAINRLYRQIASELDIGFVDLWPLVTQDDALDPAFHIDGHHLNKEAALRALGLIYASLCAPSAPIV